MWSFNRLFEKGMKYVLMPIMVVSLIVPAPVTLFAQEIPTEEGAGEQATSSPESTETPLLTQSWDTLLRKTTRKEVTAHSERSAD
jgi:hypothetical protein